MAAKAAEQLSAKMDHEGFPAASEENVLFITGTYASATKASLWDTLVAVTKGESEIPLFGPFPSSMGKAPILEALARCRTVSKEDFDAITSGGKDHEDEVEEVEEQEERLSRSKPQPTAARSRSQSDLPPRPPVDPMASRMDSLETGMADLIKMFKATMAQGSEDKKRLKDIRKSDPKDSKAVDELLEDASETDINDEESCASSLRKRRALVAKKKRDREEGFLYAHLASSLKRKEFLNSVNNLIRDFRIKCESESDRDTEEITLLRNNLVTFVEVIPTVTSAKAKHRMHAQFAENMEQLLLTLQKISSKIPATTIRVWKEELAVSRKQLRLKRIDFLDYDKVMTAMETEIAKETEKRKNSARPAIRPRGKIAKTVGVSPTPVN